MHQLWQRYRNYLFTERKECIEKAITSNCLKQKKRFRYFTEAQRQQVLDIQIREKYTVLKRTIENPDFFMF